MTREADRQAVQWMVLLSSGTASAADHSRFRQWRPAVNCPE